MITVIIHFIGGNSITTGINATEAEARNYYKVGSRINAGRGEHDYYETIKGVEIVR